ncbi:sensor histidine kinase [Oerskovia enterophila]|uniref:histidine kinase n=1 Tax=Oerskovia enterophila TaxID=43678 RepID=A0ABX2Y9M6_9CELL|nr:HAMP domain-containing sensor histidine kinase [Oerskovia enterophila]OCI30630.1 signal transduction histidine-protein kinase/phosphatase MprB [Oerskovia enterophila]
MRPLPRPVLRPTLRARLTAVYAAAFVVAGAVLIAVLYVLLAAAIDRQPLDSVGIAVGAVQATDPGLYATLDASTSAALVSGEAIPFSPVEDLTPTATYSDTAGTLTDLRDVVQLNNQEARDQTLRTVLTWSVVALLGIGVLAVGFGWVMSSRVLAPLHRITATARRVADTNLHERIAHSGPDDELKDLADTFDAMLERLDRSFDGQRRFVANASHELRTPLTISRTVLEVALDDPETHQDTRHLGATLLAVNARQERLIEGLLTLAAADRAPIVTETVDLAEVAAQAVATAGVSARDAGVDLRLDTAPTPLLGDAVLLERLVQNLVDNAVRYNEPGGRVAVATRPGPGGTVEVAVSNTGPVVPSYEVEALFEPFRRLGRDGAVADRRGGYVRGGVGLGLSIVRSVAAAHDGEVTAEPREGGGLTVVARLPGAARPPGTTGTAGTAGTAGARTGRAVETTRPGAASVRADAGV